MKTIHKYELLPRDSQEVWMPLDAVIISVHTQREKLCIWALVNDSHMQSKRVIEAFGTGHEIPDGNRYFIGTALMADGALVWHVFERTA